MPTRTMILGALAVSSVLAIGLSACEREADKKHVKTSLYRYYELEVDLSAEGRRFLVKGTFECEMRLSPGGLNTGGGGPGTGWRTRPRYLAKRLPSGAALQIYHNSLCNRGRNPGDWQKHPEIFVKNIPPDSIPEIAWYNDAVRPTRAEFYQSDIYYEQPNPRVRVHRMAARPLVTGRNYQRYPRHDPRSEMPLAEDRPILRGYSAVVAPKALFDYNKEFLDYLNTFSHVTQIDSSILIKYGVDGFALFERRGGCGYMVCTKSWSKYNERHRQVYAVSRRAHPVIREKNKYILDPSANAVRGIFISDAHTAKCSYLRVHIGSDIITVKPGPPAGPYYDPKSKTLIMFSGRSSTEARHPCPANAAR